jgi:fluoride exporter
MSMLVNTLVVAAGGAVGAALRFATSAGCAACWGTRVPIATLVVNVVGCLVGGVLVGGMLVKDGPDQTLRLLLITGVLGGLTTFSAFGLETVELVRQGHWAWAFLNVAANVGLGLVAVAVGLAIGLALRSGLRVDGV